MKLFLKTAAALFFVLSFSSAASGQYISAEQESFAKQAITETAHLWFFYASDCPYCAKQLPIIKRVAKAFKINVLGVSINNEVLAGAESLETVFDRQLKVMRLFDIEVTPAIVLVTTKGKAANDPTMVLIAQGLFEVAELERNMVIGMLAAVENNHSRQANKIKGGAMSQHYSAIKNQFEDAGR